MIYFIRWKKFVVALIHKFNNILLEILNFNSYFELLCDYFFSLGECNKYLRSGFTASTIANNFSYLYFIITIIIIFIFIVLILKFLSRFSGKANVAASKANLRKFYKITKLLSVSSIISGNLDFDGAGIEHINELPGPGDNMSSALPDDLNSLEQENNVSKDNIFNVSNSDSATYPSSCLKLGSGELNSLKINEELEDSNSDSESLNSIDENKGWADIQTSFENLTDKDKEIYIQNKMELKGLNTNSFLSNYFIQTILTNTSGSKKDVDNFLNKNLNTILNDQRNIQLNRHSFIRIRPLLLNNSNQSPFQSTVPFKPMDDFDLDDE